MNSKISELRTKALSVIEQAADLAAIEKARVDLLGKKGELSAIMKMMGKLSPDERKELGALANQLRSDMEQALEQKKSVLAAAALEQQLKAEQLDVTVPGNPLLTGAQHPLHKVLDEIKEIFIGMGYEIVDGPEVEYDKYNFEMLNIPRDHPARDTQDTFYVTENVLLRTQTSPMQVRTMLKGKLPIRIIAPGRVYRADEVDATHSPVFHQVEGMVIDKGVTMGDLKATLEVFAKRLYGENTVARFRPSHFPFTEPSAEMDVTCFRCGGKGCSLCKGEGWIELLGCGMIHPKVLRDCGIDPEVYSGWALGMGLERVVMNKYQIDDLRLFYENDLRFLTQFN